MRSLLCQSLLAYPTYGIARKSVNESHPVKNKFYLTSFPHPNGNEQPILITHPRSSHDRWAQWVSHHLISQHYQSKTHHQYHHKSEPQIRSMLWLLPHATPPAIMPSVYPIVAKQDGVYSKLYLILDGKYV